MATDRGHHHQHILNTRSIYAWNQSFHCIGEKKKQGFYMGMVKYSLGESYGVLMSFKVKLVQHFKVISQVM